MYREVIVLEIKTRKEEENKRARCVAFNCSDDGRYPLLMNGKTSGWRFCKRHALELERFLDDAYAMPRRKPSKHTASLIVYESYFEEERLL